MKNLILINLNSLGLPQLVEVICQNTLGSLGRVCFDGVLVNHHANPKKRDNPVAVIDENCRLCAELTLAENFCFFGQSGHMIYSKRRMQAVVQQIFSQFGLGLDPGTTASSLRPYERSLVELVFTLMRQAKLIILREPESYLGDQEIKNLIHFVQATTKGGASFLYASNHVKNVSAACHRIALMNNGQIIKILEKHDMELVNLAPFLSSIPVEKQRTFAETSPENLVTFRNVWIKNLSGLTCGIQKNTCTVLVDEFGKCTRDIMALMTASLRPSRGEILWEGRALRNTRSFAAVRAQGLSSHAPPSKPNSFTI